MKKLRKIVRKETIKTRAENAVTKFEKAQQDLNEFIEENPEFIEELRELVDEHNAALKEATNAVKEELKASPHKSIVIGNIGAQKKNKDHWDGNILMEILPFEISKRFITKIVQYKVDRDRLKQLIEMQEIDQDEVLQAYKKEDPIIALKAGCPKEFLI
jgi:hypothetical protein